MPDWESLNPDLRGVRNLPLLHLHSLPGVTDVPTSPPDLIVGPVEVSVCFLDVIPNSGNEDDRSREV